MRKLILIALIISACSKPATVTPTATAPVVVTRNYLIKTYSGTSNRTWLNGKEQVFYTLNFEGMVSLTGKDSCIIRVVGGSFPSLNIYENGNLIYNFTVGYFQEILNYTLKNK